MTKTNYILIASLFAIGQVFVSLPYIEIPSAYAMGQGMGGGQGNQGGGGGQGNQGGGGGNQGQGGGNANAGGNNPKAQANKNKNTTQVEKKQDPSVKRNMRLKKEAMNKRQARVREFCKNACGINGERVRTDEEKHSIAIELIEAINRSRGYE